LIFLKVNFTLKQAMMAQRGSRYTYSSTVSLTSALDCVGGQPYVPTALPPQKTRYPYYILITNSMPWLLFIHKILFSSTCFEPQVLIFRRIQLYTCSLWYCHSLSEFLVACRYTAWVGTQSVYRQATRNSPREWQYHMLHVYNCILLKMSTWGLKYVEENSILW